MRNALAYFDTAATKAEPTVLQRCFRAMQIVAAAWTLAGAVILFSCVDSTSVKARIFGIGCLFVAGAIYSVYFPLYYILLGEKKSE